MLTTFHVRDGRWHCLLTVGLLLAAGGVAQAQQRGVEPTVKTGTLVEVIQKGRATTLKYTDEAGEEQTMVLNAKVQAYVQAPGDTQFLRPGQFIFALATESNGQLFAKEVTVVLMGKGRPPAGRIQKAPPKQGQSQNAYQVTGPITAIGQDKEYPQYQRVELQAAGPRAPLMLEEDVAVTVRSMDFSLAAAGTPIELEGTELKNGRFVPTRVAANLDEPIKAEDVFGADESQKGGDEPQKPAEN